MSAGPSSSLQAPASCSTCDRPFGRIPATRQLSTGSRHKRHGYPRSGLRSAAAGERPDDAIMPVPGQASAPVAAVAVLDCAARAKNSALSQITASGDPGVATPLPNWLRSRLPLQRPSSCHNPAFAAVARLPRAPPAHRATARPVRLPAHEPHPISNEMVPPHAQP